jgi:hypothetical protein
MGVVNKMMKRCNHVRYYYYLCGDINELILSGKSVAQDFLQNKNI